MRSSLPRVLLLASLFAGCDSSPTTSTAAASASSPSTVARSSAPASATSAASAPAPSASVAAAPPLKVGDVALVDFTLGHSSKLDEALAKSAWRPIQGCGQVKEPGRAVTCVYGDRAVRLRNVEKKAKLVKEGDKYRVDGGYVLVNTVLLSDGEARLAVIGGSEGKLEDAERVVKELWDDKAKTFGGKKLAELKTDKDIAAAAETKGFTGNVFNGVDFALRKASVTTLYKREPEAGLTSRKSGDAAIEVEIEQKDGTKAKEDEQKLLAAALGEAP